MEQSSRKQINIRLEQELYDFLVFYSKKNYKTVTAVVREIIADLYKSTKSVKNNANNIPIIVEKDE
jgi:predicted DNA-binding protein